MALELKLSICIGPIKKLKKKYKKVNYVHANAAMVEEEDPKTGKEISLFPKVYLC